MSRISRPLFLLVGVLAMGVILMPTFDAAAQDKKKKKKDDPKEVKKDDKDKKEEKKEPFKPDPAQIEFKHVEKDKTSEKEKTFWVYAVVFGADGKTVAASYGDRSVRIFDIGKKSEVQALKGPAKDAKGLAQYKSLVYAGDQVFVGTGWWNDKKKAREGEIRAWDAKTGKSGKALAGHILDIEGLAISKDGKFLASASEDQTVKIWDLSKGADTITIKGHTDSVTNAAFSPDGKQLVTTSKDKTLRVWDIAGAKELASFKVEREAEVKDGKGKVTKQKELGREFTNAVFTSDGKSVIGVNLDGIIKIFDVEAKKETKELKAHEGIWALALSPDGTKLATGGYDQTIKLWNVADGKELRTIKAHLANVTTVSFSPDNQWLASGSTDGLVKIWSVK